MDLFSSYAFFSSPALIKLYCSSVESPQFSDIGFWEANADEEESCWSCIFESLIFRILES